MLLSNSLSLCLSSVQGAVSASPSQQPSGQQQQLTAFSQAPATPSGQQQQPSPGTPQSSQQGVPSPGVVGAASLMGLPTSPGQNPQGICSCRGVTRRLYRIVHVWQFAELVACTLSAQLMGFVSHYSIWESHSATTLFAALHYRTCSDYSIFSLLFGIIRLEINAFYSSLPFLCVHIRR